MSKTSKKTTKNAPKTIEEKYKKVDQHKHILMKSGMYIGSTKREKCTLWIYNEEKNENGSRFILKDIIYVPGLYKIFDEILTNARDHRIRTIDEKLEECTIIKVNIDKATGRITIFNNGAGIECVTHKKHNMFVPSLIFGELLSSSNYDDNDKRKVGGTNGLGAKLTNIYSKEFEVETLDAINNKKFYQKFSNNMYTKDKPKVTSGKGKKPYTKISFIPDYERFGLKGLTKDIIALFKKRVYDIAMNSGVKVYYNDSIIATNNFTKYIDLYFPEGSEHQKVLDITDENWKVCVVYDPTDKMDHQNISFVNGICTNRGGSHVDYVANQIVTKIKAKVTKRLKKTKVDIKPNMIKENLIFFVDSVIINPEFDTQTKEMLKTKVKDFGSTYNAPEAFLNKIVKTGVVEQIVANAQARAEASLGKGGKGRGGPRLAKLYNAHKAGPKEGYKCTIILTEGDSAKTFAMSGLNVIGRDYYGVFPLRGKLLNVRDESPTKIAGNEEIKAIMQIMGLDPTKKYTDPKGLRYGSIMILTDSDADGSHIKGLIMNFIHHFWPSLIKYEGFIRSFATPLLKATKGKGKNAQVIPFTNMQSFEEWKKENNDAKGWTLKYYKGLGTSKPAEAQECFEDLEDKLISYYWQTKQKEEEDILESKEKKKKKINSEFIDEESDLTSEVYKPRSKDVCEDAITLAFAKKRENDRKLWLNTYKPDVYIDDSEKRISYYDFIHKELIAFSVYDTARSIPNLMDGFKPSQRKVYFGSVEENIYKEEIKVAQLSGAISKRTAYHHGEQSLNDTIIKMAQNYVGSNNLNLLMPNGQFGSRLCGGQDAASPRYIFTQLDAIGKKIFIEDDFDILEHQMEDGKKIEPTFYAPVIPMILVNGAEGIGTGYSTNIEPCNPRDIYENLKRIIAGEKPKVMTPWYRHFTGTIEKVDKNKYLSRAKYDVINNDTIHISDLPIGVWTDNYKAFLDNLLDQGIAAKAQEKKDAKNAAKNKKATKGSKTKGKGRGGSKNSKYLAKKSKKSSTAKVAKKNTIGSDIKTYKEDCTEIRISFTITFHPGKLQSHIKKGTLEKSLKLFTPLNLTNMHLFNENGKIKKYETYGAILKNFAKVRLELYQKRKDYLLGKWNKELDMLKWKLKFVEGVIADEIIVFKKKSAQIIEQLEKLKFPKFTTGDKKNPSYDYLTSMTIIRFSQDEVEKLRQQILDKKEEIETLEGKTATQLWEEELDDFIDVYDKWETEQDAEYEKLMFKKKGAKKNKKGAAKKTNTKAVEAES